MTIADYCSMNYYVCCITMPYRMRIRATFEGFSVCLYKRFTAKLKKTKYMFSELFPHRDRVIDM